ncbi:hypothetical protein UM590_10845 [Staphylococcus aureus]|nr:hypothetical protein UM590_10845 [Staphylococcus aureus]
MVQKHFDNGMICASEQVVVIDKEIYKDVTNEFKAHQAYFVKKDELQRFENAIMNEQKTSIKPDIVGKSAVEIAELAGIPVPKIQNLS